MTTNDPTPTDPKPTDPKPPESAASDPTASAPTPPEAARSEPVPKDPQPPEPAGSEPAAPEPAPSEPVGAEPAPAGSGVPDVPESAAAGEPESVGRPRSGLRNPRGAVRVLGTLTLVLEAVALLLAIAPLRMLGGPHTTAAIVSVVVLAGVAVVLAGLLRYNATWYLVGALNLAVTLAGFLQWALGVLGVVFALVWWYVLHVRRTILGG